MAYHRSGHGARGLNNSFLRRRSLLKRILQERAESASKTALPPQALIIGPGGIANIQPIGEVIASSSEGTSISQDTSDHRSAEVDPQTQDSQTVVFGGDSGQVALVQTESEEVLQTSSSTLRPSAENAPPSPTPLAIHRLPLHPSQSQPESFSEAYSSPPVLSLVVSPISASLPPLLSSPTSSASSSSPTAVGSSTTSTDPVSTGVDNASDAPPLSQNPPIIVGILMVVLIVLAATVALVSWLTRSARRRRKNRLEALTFKTDNSEEGLAKVDSHPFEETDMEEAMNCARPDREPVVPFYIEPHSTIFNHENYPEDEELHDSMRVHDGAYLPSLPHNVASYQPPRHGMRFGDQLLPHQGVRPIDGPKAHPGPRKHDPNFLFQDDHPVLQLSTHAQDMAITSSKSGRPFNLPLDLASQNAHPGITRPSPISGLSWANALRTNLVSALDVVKHATGDRLLQGAFSSREPASSQPASVEDRFTPLPLRPGGESSSRRLQQRGTQEEYDLVFGRDRSRTGSKMTGTQSRERNEESEEEEGLGALQSRDSRSSAQRGAAIGGLGRFSFEQRMANSRSQTLNTSFRNERMNEMAVHSTALSRRRSGMASGSGSSSHSTLGSDLGADATMRKRRPNVV